MRLRRLHGRPADATSPGARRVVVGVDFDEPSLATARWVATQVAPAAELVLVHVLPVPRAPEFLRGSLLPPEPFVEQVAPAMRGGLQGFAGTLGPARVRVEVRVGEPAEQLAAVAAELGADLVCVGHPRARRGAARSGRNTVERLLRRLEVPLLQGAAAAGPLVRLLAAVDGGSGSDGILARAWAVAERLEARLDVVHVLDADVRAYARAMAVAAGGSAGGADHAERGLNEAAAGWLRSSLRSLGATPGRCGVSVLGGDPGPALLGACAEQPVGLVVMGREGRDATAPGLVGSTTRLVLGAAVTPVLVVPQVARPADPADPEPGGRRGRGLWPIRNGEPAEGRSDHLVDAGLGDGGWLPPAARWGRGALASLRPGALFPSPALERPA